MPRATCSGFLGHKACVHHTPSTLWLQPAQGLDYPLSQSSAAPAWEWGTLGSKGKVLCDLSRGWHRAISPHSVQSNTTLAFPWSAGASRPSQDTQINLDLSWQAEPRAPAQTEPLLLHTETSPSHLLPHRRRGGTMYDCNVQFPTF